jgi:hypothetical protein
MLRENLQESLKELTRVIKNAGNSAGCLPFILNQQVFFCRYYIHYVIA